MNPPKDTRLDNEIRDELGTIANIDDIKRILERIIEASQGNFDHISGESSRNVQIFNKFMSEFEDSVNDINARLENLGG